MSALNESVIPGNHGKVFSTNAKEEEDMDKIVAVISKIEGIANVVVDNSVFPRELTIHAFKMIQVKEIEDAVKKVGFTAIPKDLFPLW